MTVQTIDAATAHAWLKDETALLVDVREPGEHAAQKIEQAIPKPLGRLSAAKWSESGRKVILHCQKGARAHSGCQKLLSEKPDLEVYSLEGGIEAWQAAGLPVQTGSRKVMALDRQVQLLIGLLLVSFSIASVFIHPYFVLGCACIGGGLINAGLSGWCGMAKLLARMRWNQ